MEMPQRESFLITAVFGAATVVGLLLVRALSKRKKPTDLNQPESEPLSYVPDMLLRREVLLKSKQSKCIPITVITGPLGAGKTTLVKHILENANGVKFGVVVNDYAELNIDSNYLKEIKGGEEGFIVEMTNGCVCCSLQGELEDVVLSLGKNVEYLLLETSGVSNPLALVAKLDSLVQQFRSIKLRLDCVISVLDADYLMQMESHHANAKATKRIHEADIVLLNKIDFLDDPLKAMELVKKSCRSYTKVIEAEFCNVPLESILDITPIEPEREGGRIRKGLHRKGFMRYVVNTGDKHSQFKAQMISNSRNHLRDWNSFVFQDNKLPLSLEQLQRVLNTNTWRKSVARVKGTIWFAHDPETKFSIQISGNERFQITSEGAWISSPKTEFVVVVDNQKKGACEEINQLVELAIAGSANPRAFLSEEVKEQQSDSLDYTLWERGNLCLLHLNGAKRYNKSEESLLQEFHVNILRANFVLADNINRAAASSLIAVPSSTINGSVVFAKNGFLKALRANKNYFDIPIKNAYEVEFRGKIPNCKCEW